MGVYTTRYIEAKISECRGYVYNKEDFPSVEEVIEGDIFGTNDTDSNGNIVSGKTIYYKMISGKWEKIENCPYHWKLLSPAVFHERKPYVGRYKVNGDWFYNEEPKSRMVLKDKSGNNIYADRKDYFYNSGGCIRDEYISGNLSPVDVKFRDRGFPDDMSEETIKSMTDKEGNVCKYGYSKTWCTLSEWRELYESEKIRIMNKLKDSFENLNKNDIIKHLNFIIDNMKSPVCADIEGFRKKLKDDSNETEDEYYDSPQYIIDEYIPYLEQILEEIGMIEYVSQLYDIIDEENIRIIYYLD